MLKYFTFIVYYISKIIKELLVDITYCNHKCDIGIAAREEFLAKNNSVFDAIIDFDYFTAECSKTCTYQIEHNLNKETV